MSGLDSRYLKKFLTMVARRCGLCGATHADQGLRATIIWERGTKKSRAFFISGPSGESKISLRIVDWFVTNYAKKYYTLYSYEDINGSTRRFKVYVDYKLKLKAYSKSRFDPFCRWERISIPYKGDTFIETTIGQLNFFKWALENGVVAYIEAHYATIEDDMNARNSTSRRNNAINYITPESMQDAAQEAEEVNNGSKNNNKTRKKREELSISATKSIKKETVEIVVSFN